MDLTVYVLKDQRAASVSAQQERVPARYVRAARSVFRVMQTTVAVSYTHLTLPTILRV